MRPRKTKLSTTTSITSTYAGEFASEYIAAALFSARTLEQNALTVKANIKYKQVVKKLSNTGAIADSTCDFNPTGSVALTERILTPKKLQINEQVCKDDFIADWEAEQMGFSAWDTLPPNFTQFFIANMLGIVADQTETNIWQGASTTSGYFDSFATLLAADSDVVDVDSAGTATTAANVIDKYTLGYNAIPSKVFGKPDVMLYSSANMYKFYQIALGGFGASGLGAAGFKDEGTVTEKPMFFAGIPVILCNGLADDEFVIAQKQNMWFGTGLMNDQNSVKVIDMADIDASENVRFAMKWTAAVQFGIGAEIVYYWDAP